MLNRDFSKSNKHYLNKNKFILCGIALFLVIGLIVGCIFGFNQNYELGGYNEFSVNVGSVSGKKANEFRKEIKDIVNSYNADVDTISVMDEGDLTQFVVRYTNEIDSSEQTEINERIASKLKIEITKISEHVEVEKIATASDYVYTASAILIIIAIATIFAYFRYNGASAIALLSACVLGTLGFMSVSTILRLTVGMSYFAMLVILNMLIIYSAIQIFENIKDTSYLENNDYSNAIKSGIQKSKLRLTLLSVAVMIIGVLLVLLTQDTTRLMSINVMFMAVVLLAVSCYVVPFMWSVLITHCNKRKVKKDKN